VAALGLDLWGIELQQQGKHGSLLRVYIDSIGGITIEDCEQVSRQLSALFDVEDPITGEYTLEISSPGLDRPLFTPEQFSRYIGEPVSLRMRSPVEGRRKFNGTIERVDGDSLTLSVDQQSIELSISDAEKAQLVYTG